MRQVAKRGLATAVATGGMLAAAAGHAHADGEANASVKGSPGVLSGNAIQVPVNIPVNLCGNTVNVIAALNPAFGNTCVNSQDKTARSRHQQHHHRLVHHRHTSVDNGRPAPSRPLPDRPEADPSPSRPGDPGRPGSPAKPRPESPRPGGDQGKPERPHDPGKPHHPGKPGKPAKPGKPGDPAKPGNPGKPGDPAKPAKPGKPDGDRPADEGQRNPEGPGRPGEVRIGMPGEWEHAPGGPKDPRRPWPAGPQGITVPEAPGSAQGRGGERDGRPAAVPADALAETGAGELELTLPVTAGALLAGVVLYRRFRPGQR
ncbi:hypothetical protein GCM10027168_56330 [Streptomyces capparidis]